MISKALLVLATLLLGAAAFEFLPGGEGFDANLYVGEDVLATGAGTHPVAMTFNVDFDNGSSEDGLKDLSVEMPPGLIENPTATHQIYCKAKEFAMHRESPWETSLSGESCADKTQIGVITVRSSTAARRAPSGSSTSPPPGRARRARRQPLRRADRLRAATSAKPKANTALTLQTAGTSRSGLTSRPHGDDLGHSLVGRPQRPARQLPQRGRTALRLGQMLGRAGRRSRTAPARLPDPADLLRRAAGLPRHAPTPGSRPAPPIGATPGSRRR